MSLFTSMMQKSLTSVILGLKPFKELLYAAQLKFYVRLSKQSNDRWSKDALRDNASGDWPSPYIKMLDAIKNEVGMSRWPVSVRHVDIVLGHHFLEGINSEIDRLHLPAFAPLIKRQRMDHVDESLQSQVGLSNSVSFISAGIIVYHMTFFLLQLV